MSSRSKYSKKKMLVPMTLTTIIVAAASAAALRAGLGISSVDIGHSIDSFIFTSVTPEAQAFLDSMTVYLRESS